MSTDNLKPEFTDALQMSLRNLNTIRKYFTKRTWALPLMVERVVINRALGNWEDVVEYWPDWNASAYHQKRLFIERVNRAARVSRRGPTILRMCWIERYADIVIYWLAVLLNVKPGASVVWLDSERVKFNPLNLAVDLWFGDYSRKSLDIAQRIFEHAPTRQQTLT